MGLLEDICEQYENMPLFERIGSAAPNGDRLIDALSTLYGDSDKARKVFINMSVCIADADGYFTPEEFDLIKDHIEYCTDNKVDYEEALAAMKKSKLKTRQDIIDYVKPIVKQLGEQNEENVKSFIRYSLAICSADGVICDEEKQWLSDVLS